MAKNPSFACNNCGAEFAKWVGRCPECGGWNCITEQSASEISARTQAISGRQLTTQPITAIISGETARQSTGVEELDRVLGGGLVAGSATLIGGEPGIGKSTLLLQATCLMAKSGNILYITGEESVQQVRLRGDRIGAGHPQMHLASGTDLDEMMATITNLKPQMVVIDSIQTTTSSRLTSAPGTVAQVRDCASALIRQAKQLGHALLLVGHVTKDGSIAGPRVLEHMVDAVIYFEGDRGHAHRILRAVKNRFGPAGEIGVFEMGDDGLRGVRDASKIFLAERHAGVAGSVVLACLEGTRPLLVEVQALVAPTVFATPKRSAVGVDAARTAMLTAVLERRIGIPLSQHDIYVNLVGGARIQEPAADLAVLMAILSAYQERPVRAGLVLFGEVGLTGEVRPVALPELRLREAVSFGFNELLLPASNLARVEKVERAASVGNEKSAPLRCIPVRRLAEAAEAGLA